MAGQIDSLFGSTKKIEVAKLLGVSPSTITLLNSGQRKPSNELIKRVSAALNIPAPVIWERFYNGGNLEQPTAN